MGSVSDASTVWWSADSSNIESIPLEAIDEPGTVYAACTGPDAGLCSVSSSSSSSSSSRLGDRYDETGCARSLEADDDDLVAGVKSWKTADRRAFGISLSLYEQNPLTHKLSGEPIADTYAVCARRNSAVLVIADGVNWGDKSKLAARCAVYGAMKHLNGCLSSSSAALKTSHEAFRHLHDAMAAAHTTILEHNGGLTTFCAVLVLPVSRNLNDAVGDAEQKPPPPTPLGVLRRCPSDVRRYAVCAINVGDSLAFVFSRRTGLREITIGSHDVRRARDVRDAGGALGPADGCSSPALDNLTYTLTLAEEGDIVFLATDGVTDNFDPVVTKLAAPADDSDDDRVKAAGSDRHVRPQAAATAGQADPTGRLRPELVMLPHERHLLAVKSMEMSVHEFELGKGRGGGRCGSSGGRVSGRDVSAYELCLAVMQRVVTLTDSKRLAIEGSSLFRPRPGGGAKPSRQERQEAEAEVRRQLTLCPGKLDHATIAAYEVGERKEPTAVQSTALLDGVGNVAGAAASVALRRYLASASRPPPTATLAAHEACSLRQPPPLIPTRH